MQYNVSSHWHNLPTITALNVVYIASTCGKTNLQKTCIQHNYKVNTQVTGTFLYGTLSFLNFLFALTIAKCSDKLK